VYVCMVLLVKCYVQIMAETDVVFKFMIILSWNSFNTLCFLLKKDAGMNDGFASLCFHPQEDV